MIPKTLEIKSDIITYYFYCFNNERFVERQNRIDMILPALPKLEYDPESPLYDLINLILSDFNHDPEEYTLQILAIPPEYIQDGFGYQQIITRHINHGLPLDWIPLQFNSVTILYQEALHYYDGRNLFDIHDFPDLTIDEIQYANDYQYDNSEVETAFELIRQDILESVFLLI